MVPELGSTGQESAPLIQALGGDVTPWRHHRDISNLPPLKPAERVMHELPDNSLVLHASVRPHEADLAAAVALQMAADVSGRAPVLFGYQHDVRVTMAALLDPCAIHLVASEGWKAAVLIKARVGITAGRDLAERWNVLRRRLADAVIVPSARVSAQNARRQRDANIDQLKSLPLREADCVSFGLRQKVQAVDALVAHSASDLSDPLRIKPVTGDACDADAEEF